MRSASHLVFAVIAYQLLTVLFVCAEEGEFDAKKPRTSELSLAYGFIVGQQTSLDLIAKKFPELAASAKTAEFQFQSSALGQGGDGVRAALKELAGSRWEEVEQEVSSKLEEQIQASSLTAAEARSFINSVVARSKGKMPEDIRRALLANNPRFKADPGLELSEGWRRTFRTKGHPKAGEVDIAIDVPESWFEREGRQSDILKVFRNENGHGDILLMLSVRPFSEEEKREMDGVELTPDLVSELFPRGSKVLSSQETTLSGAKAVLTVYDGKQEQLGQTVAMRNTSFWALLDDGFVALTFAFMKPASMTPQEIDAKHKRQMLSYKLIASTLTLTGSKPQRNDAKEVAVEGGSGTGFVISSSGLVVTAFHVVDGAKRIQVHKGSSSYKAEVLTENKTLDLAVLKVGGLSVSPVKFAPSSSVRLAQSVFTIGFPNADVQGVSPKVTRGEISSLNGFRDSPRHWQISVPVQPGNSGGPLFNSSGDVVGMIVGRLSASATDTISQNVNYALKGNFITRAIESYSPSVAPLGPSGQTASSDLESVVARVQNSIVMVSAE